MPAHRIIESPTGRTIFRCNGNPMRGIATVSDLGSVMADHPLMLSVAGKFGCWADACRVEGLKGYTRYQGNFDTISWSFDLSTNDPEVIEFLNERIRNNASYIQAQAQYRIRGWAQGQLHPSSR